jgi:hypothetical protein
MSRRIEDDLVRLPVSRQRKYQLRMKRTGRCTVCGKPASRNSRARCVRHLILARNRKRRLRLFQGSAPKWLSRLAPAR